MSKIKVDVLSQRLRLIRTKGYKADVDIDSLANVLGIPDFKWDKIDSLLIQLIHKMGKKDHDPYNSEIILMALGLLHGYKKKDKIGDRRETYLENSYFFEENYYDLFLKAKSGDEETRKVAIKGAKDNLRHKEDELINDLAIEILDIENLTAYANNVPNSPIYPLPSYLTIINEPVIAVTEAVSETHILTPNVSVWEDPQFLGRDVFVADLCRELITGTPHLQLTGMGGIGKSEMLHKVYLNFVENKVSHPFKHIGLLYYDGFKDSNIGQQLDFKGDKGSDAAWDYIRGLCNKDPVLLLIDDIRPQKKEKGNLDESEVFFSKLHSIKATVLLASRYLLKKFTNKMVKPLDMEHCIQLFQHQMFCGDEIDQMPSSLEIDEIQLIKKIIKYRAGYNTLIVARLGATVREYGWDIERLSNRLKNKGFNICKGQEDEEMIQEEINMLYCFQDIKKPVERSILEAFAIFPVIPLKQDVCVKWLQDDVEYDEDICLLTLNKLARRTWLTLHVDKESKTGLYTMHQMVKSAVIAQANIEFEKHIKLIAHCSEAVSFTKAESFIKAQPYIPFAISLAQFFLSEMRVEVADLMNNIGRYLEEIANFDQALKWHHKALTIRKQLLGTEHIDTATSYHNIGRVYDNKGKYPLALEWYYKALPIRENVLGCEHPDTAETYHRIGFAYHRTDYSESLRWYEKARKIREKIYGTQHLITVETYHGIAGIYTRQGKYRQALELYEKNLQIQKNNLESKHPSIALSYSCIAQVYIRQGNYTESLKLDNKALEIREEVLGVDHPDTAATLNHIAKAHTMLGQHDKALPLHNKVLEIREKKLGSGHAFTATTYNDIGEVYFLQGDLPEALKWYKKAYTVRKKVLGPESAPTATSYFNIAKVYEKLGNRLRAQILYQRALKIRKKRLGENHKSTADAYIGNARIYACQGNNLLALEYYKEALRIFESQLGVEHDSTKNTRMMMLDIEKLLL